MVRGVRRVAVVLVLVVGVAACGGSGGTKDERGSAAATTTTASSQKERQRPAAGKGNVQGVVLYDDKPALGIEVKLCAEYSRFGSGCGEERYQAITDAEGVFVIADVPPKEYGALLVRVFDTDLEQFAQSGVVSTKKYTVEADKTLFAETTHLFKADVRATAPASGSQVPPANLALRWEPYPAAAYYKVTLTAKEVTVTSPVVGQRVDGTSYTVPAAVQTGEYRLRIEAFNAKDHKLSETPDGYSFQVTG
jgi:hypothetical protein